MTDRLQELHQLIALSRAMLEKAQEDSWGEVIDLEAERSGLIETFFLEPVPQEFAVEVEAGIRSIIAMDIDVMELGKREKLDLVGNLQKMEQGKKAVRAYSS